MIGEVAEMGEATMPKKLANPLTPLAMKNAKPGRHADGAGCNCS